MTETIQQARQRRAPSPPPRRRRLLELRVAREPLRLAWQTPRLVRRAATRARPVILLPGFGTGDPFMFPLRGFLRTLGHRTHGWGLGTHGKDVEATLERFVPRLEAVAATAGEPVTLVGWSLGGIVAREAARDRPDLVAAVITFGTPIDGPRYTTAARVYTADELVEIEASIAERRGDLIQVPVTAIYSRNDGIVDWITCGDDETPGAVNIEVSSSQVGMGLDPEVWSAVADAIDRAPNTIVR